MAFRKMDRLYFLILIILGSCHNPKTGFDYLSGNKISVYNYGTWVKPNIVTIVNDSAYVNDPSSNERLSGKLLIKEKELLDSLVAIIRVGKYASEYNDSLSDATRYFIGIPKEDGLIKIELYGNNCPKELWLFSKMIAQIRRRLGWK